MMVGVVEQQPTVPITVRIVLHGLHQIVGLKRRLKAFTTVASSERAHQQKVTILIADIDGRHQGVAGQSGRQHSAPRQPVIQLLRIGHRIEGQHTQG